MKRCKVKGCNEIMYAKNLCNKHYQNRHYTQNKKKILAQKKVYHNLNREKILIRMKGYYEQNKENALISSKKNYEKNKKRHAKCMSAWRRCNRSLCNSINARRHANKLQRIPKWMNKELVKQFYIDCPNGYVVDHYYPLQGVYVSGLHVIENLQYLTQKENSRKKNRTPGIDWPESKLKAKIRGK